MRVCVYEDDGVSRLEPLTLTRPAFDLRCGATSLLARQRRLFAADGAAAWVRPHLADLCRLTNPDLAVNDPSWFRPAAATPAPVVLVNARWLAPAALPEAADGPGVGLVGEQVAFAVLPATQAEAFPADPRRQLELARQQLPRRPAGGHLIDYPWDLVSRNGETLEQDWQHWAGERTAGPAAGPAVVGPPERFLADPRARVEPLVLVDTTHGPVLVDRGAIVQAFSRLEGPCYVGPGTHVLGARLRGGSNLGPHCRVGGEVEASILHGHSNKAHDGFLGHAYVGEWVNLGAGTHNSDLRNDYGPVVMRLGGQKVETGLVKVGAFVGDHTKTSIGTLLNTGTVVGPFAQLLACGTLLPRVLPAFCRFGHGRIQEQTALRYMFATAATMMARRGVHWTDTHAELFLALYEQTAAERAQLIRESEQNHWRRVV